MKESQNSKFQTKGIHEGTKNLFDRLKPIESTLIGRGCVIFGRWLVSLPKTDTPNYHVQLVFSLSFFIFLKENLFIYLFSISTSNNSMKKDVLYLQVHGEEVLKRWGLKKTTEPTDRRLNFNHFFWSFSIPTFVQNRHGPTNVGLNQYVFNWITFFLNTISLFRFLNPWNWINTIT